MATANEIAAAITRRTAREQQLVAQANPALLYLLGVVHAGIAVGVAQALGAADEATDVPWRGGETAR